jgi:hypothetical protein
MASAKSRHYNHQCVKFHYASLNAVTESVIIYAYILRTGSSWDIWMAWSSAHSSLVCTVLLRYEY